MLPMTKTGCHPRAVQLRHGKRLHSRILKACQPRVPRCRTNRDAQAQSQTRTKLHHRLHYTPHISRRMNIRIPTRSHQSENLSSRQPYIHRRLHPYINTIRHPVILRRRAYKRLIIARPSGVYHLLQSSRVAHCGSIYHEPHSDACHGTVCDASFG